MNFDDVPLRRRSASTTFRFDDKRRDRFCICLLPYRMVWYRGATTHRPRCVPVDHPPAHPQTCHLSHAHSPTLVTVLHDVDDDGALVCSSSPSCRPVSPDSLRSPFSCRVSVGCRLRGTTLRQSLTRQCRQSRLAASRVHNPIRIRAPTQEINHVFQSPTFRTIEPAGGGIGSRSS